MTIYLQLRQKINVFIDKVGYNYEVYVLIFNEDGHIIKLLNIVSLITQSYTISRD